MIMIPYRILFVSEVVPLKSNDRHSVIQSEILAGMDAFSLPWNFMYGKSFRNLHCQSFSLDPLSKIE